MKKRVEKWSAKIGKSYVFVRDGHDWTGCEVLVLLKTARGYMVARCCEVAERYYASSEGKRAGLPPRWVASESELC
jgi:hypothetical protein